jgi:hypothetical protein
MLAPVDAQDKVQHRIASLQRSRPRTFQRWSLRGSRMGHLFMFLRCD